MHRLELITLAGSAGFAIAFLFRFIAICGIDEISPAEAMRQEWESLSGTWQRLRLRVALIRSKGAHARAETV